MQYTAFPALVDTLVHRFCTACDAPRLAYAQISRPPKPPALIEPRTTDPPGQRRGPPPPTRQDLLRLAHVLRYVHVVRKRRQSVAVADLAKAISQDGNSRLLSTSFLRKCPYLSVTSRRFHGDRHVRLKVDDPWRTLADVIDALADPHSGRTDVDTLKKIFYALCPAFNRRLPKGIPTLSDFLAAFPGTFDTSTPGGFPCRHPGRRPLRLGA